MIDIFIEANDFLQFGMALSITDHHSILALSFWKWTLYCKVTI